VKRLVVVATITAAVVLVAGPASAHPLGNFTINTYDGLRVAPDHLSVDHVIDMAEIPTFQRRDEIDADHDGVISAREAAAYASATCTDVARALVAALDGTRVGLAVTQSSLGFPPGAGGLPTMRVTCELAARLSRAPRTVSFEDPTFADHIGWHEITAVGDRATLGGANVPTSSVSDRLTRYPQDLLRSPLDQRTATFTVKPGGVPAAPAGDAAAGRQARGVDALTQAFTSLVASHRASIPFAMLALVIAIVLGGVHALAPGHGKTVMAAYVVGRRGSFGQAALIGATVTATHTAGVVAIGIALTLSHALAPERVYPWLGLASGLLLIAVGSTMARSRMRDRREHDHGLAHDHGHERGPPAPVGKRSLVAMGFVGGLVPSPSALVVLLGAIALGRLWFGILLIAAYGAGMGGTLAGAGLVLVRARGRLERSRSARWTRAAAVVPSIAAFVVVALGIVTAARGAAKL
jgi:nickel/cobalt transporter (NicO) family protein